MKLIRTMLVVGVLVNPMLAHAAMSDGINNFGINLYNLVNKDSGNVFFSPHSIATALSMTYAGAREETEREMADVLGASSFLQEEYHKRFADVANFFEEENPEFSLKSANKIFISDRIKASESFSARVSSYGTAWESVDFGNNVEVSDSINQWTAERTNNKIQNIVEPEMFSGSTMLALVNALYLKGRWLEPFEQYNTTKQSFYIADEESIFVDMMRQVNHFNYVKTDDFCLLELPYCGDRLSMFVVLPEETTSVNAIKLFEINDAIEQKKETYLDVRLPKFKIETTYQLNNALAQLGMPTAFTEEANFLDITGSMGVPLYISRVIHKAFIEIDEQGTEAAAATAIICRALSCPLMPQRPQPIVFNANKPFLFFIQDLKTKAILFMGKVDNPG